VIVIGLVVHRSRRAVFAAAASVLTGVALEWVEYEFEDDVRGLVEGLLRRRHLHGLLLGPVPYEACRDLLPDGLCVDVVEPTGLDLALAFYRATALGWTTTPVSVDTFEPGVVTEVAEALDLDREAIGCLPYASAQSSAEIVEFHRQFLRRTGGGYVVTNRTAVQRALDGTVPVLNGAPVRSTIRAQLHELALRVQSSRANAMRFAACVFRVVRQDGRPDLDRARVGLLHTLVNMPEFAEAWVENRGRGGVVVFANVALFERVTHNWTVLPALRQAAHTIGAPAVAGFGIGASARTCVQLAEQAANRAEADEPPCGYLIDDGGVMIGPMGQSGSPLAFTYREHGDNVEELARTVGLSPATLSRLAAVERAHEGRSVSSRDLADALGITDASGRRLLRKLSSHRLATGVGSAQTNRNGRPNRLYHLGIVEAIARRP
jgi:DNA-binding Xre family transcriptional regulator